MGAIFSLLGWDIVKEWWYQLLGMGLLFFSIFSVFIETQGIQPNVQQAQLELFQTLTDMSAGLNYGPLNPKERELVDRAIMVCATQGEIDLYKMTVDLEKAQRFGPIMTLFDGLNSMTTTKAPMRCLDYYHELRKSKPSAFILFESQNPWVISPTSR